jgi:phage shock protein A
MTMETTLRPTALRTTDARANAPTRPSAPSASAAAREAGTPAAARRPASLKRGVAGANSQLQDAVARAQQARDYLSRVAAQLETVKSQLAAKLTGARGDERQLEARVRELAASLAARRQGGGVDANLDFNGDAATQRFRIPGLDIDALQQAAPQTLAFSIGAAGGPQLSATIEPGMDAGDIAARLDRTLAPLNVHAQLDQRGQLVFSTSETNYQAVKDSIAVSGRGRVATEPVAPAFDAGRLGTGNVDALRQSLREVVQALARVRRAQDAADAALSAAGARAAQASANARAAEAAQHAQQFVDTASNPDYAALIEMTSALVGVSRERVLALLGLR